MELDLTKVLHSRYATKKFDATKKISDENICIIEDLLQMAPSSNNLQAWHFIMATTQDGKNQIAKSTEGSHISNKEKILNASVVIVFATKIDIDDQYLEHLTQKAIDDGRLNHQNKSNGTNIRKDFINLHKFDYKDITHWLEKQLYLNLGSLLLGVATLGIDAIAMEGIDTRTLNNEFGLIEKGLNASVVVALGYRQDDDFNATLKKTRLDKSEIITKI